MLESWEPPLDYCEPDVVACGLIEGQTQNTDTSQASSHVLDWDFLPLKFTKQEL